MLNLPELVRIYVCLTWADARGGSPPSGKALSAALERLPCLAGSGSAKVLPKTGSWGDGLHPLELGGALRLHRGWLAGHQQQRGRETR